MTQWDAALVVAGDVASGTWDEVTAEWKAGMTTGGHLVVLCGPYGYHRVAGFVEDAGFEVRDSLAWVAGVDGSGPEVRHVLLARNGLEGTYARCVLKHGQGALNIDDCRLTGGEAPKPTLAPGWAAVNRANQTQGYRPVAYAQEPAMYVPSELGRWPSNAVFTHAHGCSDGEGCVPGCGVPGVHEQAGSSAATFPMFDGVNGLAGWLLRLVCPPGSRVLLSSSLPDAVAGAVADIEVLRATSEA